MGTIIYGTELTGLVWFEYRWTSYVTALPPTGAWHVRHHVSTPFKRGLFFEVDLIRAGRSSPVARMKGFANIRVYLDDFFYYHWK